jgi:hypothetical protein
MHSTISPKILLAILSALFRLALQAQTEELNNFYYSVSNGQATILAYGLFDSPSVTIPSTIAGYPVTSIGPDAFNGLYNTQQVNIPAGVTSIEAGAFYGAGLTNIVIPEGVTNIGQEALFCENLVQVVMPNTVTSMGEAEFLNCHALASVTLSTNLTSLGANAFGYCLSLRNITLPPHLTLVDPSAFIGCTSLTNIVIPDSVSTIGMQAFEYCYSLTNVTIGKGVSEVAIEAFANCITLQEVYFRGSAPPQETAFSGCTNVLINYLPGTTGWGSTWDLMPTALWNPQIEPGFGMNNHQFGMNVRGTPNITVQVSATTNLAGPEWTPVGTLVLTNGTASFSEAELPGVTGRFYQLTFP